MTNKNLQLEELKKIYGKISPFEFKNKLIDLAKEKKKCPYSFRSLDVEILTGQHLHHVMPFYLWSFCCI